MLKGFRGAREKTYEFIERKNGAIINLRGRALSSWFGLYQFGWD